MITFDLACPSGHRFEGWFRNREEFDRQLAAGQVICPLCGSARVEKQLSAVSVHVGRHAAPAPPPAANPAPAGGGAPAGAPAAGTAPVPAGRAAGVPAQPFFQALTRFIESHFEDVGNRFAAEARKVESGEVAARNIRGTTTPEEEAELREEGVEFLKVAVPKYDA